VKKLSHLLLITVLLGSFTVVKGQNTYAMYKAAQKYFRAYHYDVDMNDFQVKEYREGGRTILQLLIILHANRNRFDEAMLVGFGAAGAALATSGEQVDQVNVVVKVQYRREVSISAIADASDVKRLYAGDIDLNSFMARLTWV